MYVDADQQRHSIINCWQADPQISSNNAAAQAQLQVEILIVDGLPENNGVVQEKSLVVGKSVSSQYPQRLVVCFTQEGRQTTQELMFVGTYTYYGGDNLQHRHGLECHHTDVRVHKKRVRNGITNTCGLLRLERGLNVQICLREQTCPNLMFCEDKKRYVRVRGCTVCFIGRVAFI